MTAPGRPDRLVAVYELTVVGKVGPVLQATFEPATTTSCELQTILCLRGHDGVRTSWTSCTCSGPTASMSHPSTPSVDLLDGRSTLGSGGRASWKAGHLARSRAAFISPPWTVSAQMTSTSSTIIIMDQTG